MYEMITCYGTHLDKEKILYLTMSVKKFIEDNPDFQNDSFTEIKSRYDISNVFGKSVMNYLNNVLYSGNYDYNMLRKCIERLVEIDYMFKEYSIEAENTL